MCFSNLLDSVILHSEKLNILACLSGAHIHDLFFSKLLNHPTLHRVKLSILACYIFIFLTKSSSQSYLIILRRVKIEYFTLLFIFFKKFISLGTTNFRKHECQCPQFKVLQSVFCLFYMNSNIGIFLVYFDLN